jgi:hypothetical protein
MQFQEGGARCAIAGEGNITSNDERLMRLMRSANDIQSGRPQLVAASLVLCISAGFLIASPAAAQQAAAPAMTMSNLAQVQLSIVVPPRVMLASAGAVREVSRNGSTAMIAAPLGVGGNTAYQVVVHRVPDACQAADGTERRVWVRNAGGAFSELTNAQGVTAQPVMARAPGAGATVGQDELQYRVTSAGAACDTALPVRYDIQVAPTL